MCGIAGIWNRSGEPVERDALEAMSALLVHRGPDGAGVHLDGDVGLANRRLAIIDPSAAGNQPLGLAERGLWLTYNGEIHNYVELRRELEAAGARFRTGTDTEVVLHAYARWGADCFERFNGMWALALWDTRRQELVLSRDRFGIKPLYYAVRGARLCFASEPKAIVAAFPEEREPDLAELSAFLAGRRPDRTERTFFANVKNVLPATFVVFGRDGERRAKYWRFEPGDETPKPDAEERFRELLRDAVRIRQRSDVPVGAAVSGGLDSSSIVRLLDDHGGEPIPCFATTFDEPSVDESRYAALAAAGERFVVHWVRPHPQDMVETIRKIVWHHDAPMPFRGRFAQWFVMEEAGRHVKVILAGQGGDELLGGYIHFIRRYLSDRVRLRDPAPPRPRAPLLREIFDLSEVSGQPPAHGLVRAPFRRLLQSRRRDVRSPEVIAAPVPSGEERARAPYQSRLNNALWREFTHDGLPELLHAEDALGMAFSVESRTPFMDHRLVEFCFTLPYWEKISDGWTKSILRRALASELPPEIRSRRRKLGFPAPVGPWLRREQNWRAVEELLLDPRCLRRGIFDAARLERELARARRAQGAAGRVWQWITVELWFRDFVDAAARARG